MRLSRLSVLLLCMIGAATAKCTYVQTTQTTQFTMVNKNSSNWSFYFAAMCPDGSVPLTTTFALRDRASRFQDQFQTVSGFYYSGVLFPYNSTTTDPLPPNVCRYVVAYGSLDLSRYVAIFSQLCCTADSFAGGLANYNQCGFQIPL